MQHAPRGIGGGQFTALQRERDQHQQWESQLRDAIAVSMQQQQERERWSRDDAAVAGEKKKERQPGDVTAIAREQQ